MSEDLTPLEAHEQRHHTLDQIADNIATRIYDTFNATLGLITKGLDLDKAHPDDAAHDLEACERNSIHLLPGSFGLVRTGVFVAVPRGHVGLVCSRSGLAAKHGVFVLNAPGVIDPGYRGEVGVVLANLGHQSYEVRPGDRIAQLLVLPLGNVKVLNNAALFDAMRTSRADGGFGSTGVA